MMQHQIDGRDEVQQVAEVTTLDRDGGTLTVGRATRKPSSQKVQGVAFRLFVTVDDTVLASPDDRNDILRRLLEHDQTVWEVLTLREPVAAVTHASCIVEWDSYILGADGIERGDFAAVTDEEGQVVGIACPTCGRPMLWSVQNWGQQDLQDCDEDNCMGFRSLLRCRDIRCPTIVLLTREAMFEYLPKIETVGLGADGYA